MRTWVRARYVLPCGGCRATIQAGAVMLEIQIAETDTRRARCGVCAKRMFGEDPPTELPVDELVVPQPSLPMPRSRGADFVTPAALTRHNRYTDFRRRQSGDAE